MTIDDNNNSFSYADIILLHTKLDIREKEMGSPSVVCVLQVRSSMLSVPGTASDVC